MLIFCSIMPTMFQKTRWTFIWAFIGYLISQSFLPLIFVVDNFFSAAENPARLIHRVSILISYLLQIAVGPSRSSEIRVKIRESMRTLLSDDALENIREMSVSRLVQWDRKRVHKILERGFSETEARNFLRARERLWGQKFDTLFPL